MFIDNLADAIIRLETRIEQTEESIKLAATKDYVDEETGKVYTKYDSQLNITAGQISAISTRVDNIRNEIDTAGWINTTQGNTLFAAKSLENGDNIISYINQTATTTTIKAERINLVGAVTFNMFNTDVKIRSITLAVMLVRLYRKLTKPCLTLLAHGVRLRLPNRLPVQHIQTLPRLFKTQLRPYQMPLKP